MKDLSTPSRELALRVGREVEFRDRLTAGSLHPRSGITVVDLYCLEEAYHLLGEPLPRLDLCDLASWVRTALGDTELADRIARDCDVAADALTLILTPTQSLAGTVQVVARVLEVALHKAHELGFPMGRILDGAGGQYRLFNFFFLFLIQLI